MIKKSTQTRLPYSIIVRDNIEIGSYLTTSGMDVAGITIEIPLRHRCKSNLLPMSHEDKMRRFLNFGYSAKVIVTSAANGRGFKSSQPDRDFHV